MKSSLLSWKFWVGMAISGLCVWLALRRVKLEGLGEQLKGMNAAYLAPAVVLQLLAVVARSWRWIVLLRVRGRLLDGFFAQGLGYLFTNVLPLRMGEPVRIVAMAERCQVPMLEVASTAILERLLDVATILLTLLVLVPVLTFSPALAHTAILFTAICLGVLLALLLSVVFRESFERLLRALCKGLSEGNREGLIERWRELILGIRPLFAVRTSVRAVALSILTWSLSIATYWCVMLAFNPAATPVEAAFLIVALAFAVSIPSSPGFIGVFHLVAQQTLAFQFASKYNIATALSVALTGHLVYFITTTVLGIIGIWRFGGSSGQWRKAASRLQSALRRANPAEFKEGNRGRCAVL
jgi:hypothetical protein